MRRTTFLSAVVFLAMSAAIANAQESEPAVPLSTPAATYSQAYCTGFIAESVPHDLYVLGGGDDDFHSVVRQFVQGESIFIAQRSPGNIAVGAEYSVIRPAKDLFETMHYQGEAWDLRKLGNPYADIAQIKVTHVTPKGVVAKVTFGCEAVMPGDTLVPFQPRTIPEYSVSRPLDHFAPLDYTKERGRIAASHNNYGYLGDGTVVYLNLGASEVQPGKRFRIYKVLSPEKAGTLSKQRTPPETIGEAVVLSVQPKSSVAIVVSSYREVSSGDYVEAE